MIKIILGVVAIALAALPGGAQQGVPLTLQQTIELPGVLGKFDHFAMDAAGGRLFVSATGNHSVEVIDLASGKVDQSISGLGKPHGLAWITSNQSLFVADGALGELQEYQGRPLKLTRKLKLSDDADDMVYDPALHLLYVGHGGSDASNPGRIAAVDVEDLSLRANIPVATHPEALDLDGQGRQIFANIADAGEVAVVEIATNRIRAHWKLSNATDNVPVTFDADHGILYVACRKPAVLLALDSKSGVELARAAIGEGADDLFYDSTLRRVYVIDGVGEVDTFQVDSQKTFRPLPALRTVTGAKTALFVSTQSRLYVGIPGADGHSAQIRIYKTQAQRGSN